VGGHGHVSSPSSIPLPPPSHLIKSFKVTGVRYDPNNKEHVALKSGIEVGNGLPDLETPDMIVDALKKAGFEVLEAYPHLFFAN
jgi:hypothetical protein